MSRRLLPSDPSDRGDSNLIDFGLNRQTDELSIDYFDPLKNGVLGGCSAGDDGRPASSLSAGSLQLAAPSAANPLLDSGRNSPMDADSSSRSASQSSNTRQRSDSELKQDIFHPASLAELGKRVSASSLTRKNADETKLEGDIVASTKDRFSESGYGSDLFKGAWQAAEDDPDMFVLTTSDNFIRRVSDLVGSSRRQSVFSSPRLRDDILQEIKPSFDRTTINIEVEVTVREHSGIETMDCALSTPVDMLISQMLYHFMDDVGDELKRGIVLKVLGRYEFFVDVDQPMGCFELVQKHYRSKSQLRLRLVEWSSVHLLDPLRPTNKDGESWRLYSSWQDALSVRANSVTVSSGPIKELAEGLDQRYATLLSYLDNRDLPRNEFKLPLTHYRQSVKQICAAFGQIKTLPVKKLLERLTILCGRIENGSGADIWLNDVSSVLRDLNAAVFNLIDMYKALYVPQSSDFEPHGSDLSGASRRTSIADIPSKQEFHFDIFSLLRVPADWLSQWDVFTVACGLFYGGRQVAAPLLTGARHPTIDETPFFIDWDELLTWPHPISALPRETKLLLVVYGAKKILLPGATATAVSPGDNPFSTTFRVTLSELDFSTPYGSLHELPNTRVRHRPISVGSAAGDGASYPFVPVAWVNFSVFAPERNFQYNGGGHLLPLWTYDGNGEPVDPLFSSSELNMDADAPLLHVRLSGSSSHVNDTSPGAMPHFPKARRTESQLDQLSPGLLSTLGSNAANRRHARKRSETIFSELHPNVQDNIRELIGAYTSTQQHCSSNVSYSSVLELPLAAAKTLDIEKRALLWQRRFSLLGFPSSLPLIVLAKNTWSSVSLPEFYQLLELFSPYLPLSTAFELLLPLFPDIKIKEMAVELIRKYVQPDQAVHFLPYFLCALKADGPIEASPVALLLFYYALNNIDFAHSLYWMLDDMKRDRLHAVKMRRFTVMLEQLIGPQLSRELTREVDMIGQLSNVAEAVKATKQREQRYSILQQQLSENLSKFFDPSRTGSTPHFFLPISMSWRVTQIDLRACAYFPSNALPLKLVFTQCDGDERADPVSVMYKAGDDLRHDRAVLQLIRLMDEFWLTAGLDLRIVTYLCTPTAPLRGLVELIPESETLGEIQRSLQGRLTGNIKGTIASWLKQHNPQQTAFEEAVENFTLTCAGYSVATYVLGIGDRHNDNIMICHTGHLFHIDFGRFLGQSEMFLNFKRDRVPFVFTEDMANVIKCGGEQNFQHFVDTCCKAFNIVRRNGRFLLVLLSLLLQSGVPGITRKGLEHVHKALLPGLTDDMATHTFTQMLHSNLKAFFTGINFIIHNFAQMKYGTTTDGRLLSFIPANFTAKTDGHIVDVRVVAVQKLYSPEKCFQFVLNVQREGERRSIDSSENGRLIFRKSSEIIEFQNKLQAMFPFVDWPPLNLVRALHQGKKARPAQQQSQYDRASVGTLQQDNQAIVDLRAYLVHLLCQPEEVSQSDIVYTFLHPIARDHQEIDSSAFQKSSRPSSTIRPASSELAGQIGQVKLSIYFQRGALHVMVSHCRHLPSSIYSQNASPPDPYVKLYLTPDPAKETKRKTNICKNTRNPTFNEVIVYDDIPESQLLQRKLYVSVWHYDRFRENELLGAFDLQLSDVVTSLNSRGLYCENEWFQFNRPQRTA